MSDPTSQSNYEQIATEHATFDWDIDFEARIISGSVIHDLRVKEDGVQEVIFDTGDLDIQTVEVDGKKVSHSVGHKHPVMGSALRVPLPPGLKSGSSIPVKVTYKTTKECTALQWLAKEQTQGKTFPYLFSQCQPIYARALSPIQDTPSVKIKYSAKVRSTLPVLLSAIRKSPPLDGPAHDGKVIVKTLWHTNTTRLANICDSRPHLCVTNSPCYHIKPVPIPSYLIAIACGNVRYRPFPKYEDKEWKCGIWAEPELIDAAYWEFSEDTARFLAAEEKLVTPYQFGVYDLLVLPPSFPYGGMENACLSFLTPTLLAGDRTLVDVVVHELTHSWFGNGITHANASHFWLNEGWTTYIERVLQEKLHSPSHRAFSFLIGSRALKNALKEYENTPKYQRLIIKFEKGENPDDAYSSIPYEKGANLLLNLERTLGGLDAFLPYVKDYVSTFIGKSIMTDQWKAHLYAFYEKHGGNEKIKLLNSIDWDAWFFGEGLSLPVEMEYDLTLAQEAYDLAERWDASRSILDPSELPFKKNDLEKFNSNQVVVFLERLESFPSLPSGHITVLGSLYHLSSSPNAEIRLRFYEVALRDPSTPAAELYSIEAANWVVGSDGTGVIKGRMKFCRPVFRAVNKVDPVLAVGVFEKSKEAFHPIARKLIEKDLGLA